MPRDDQAFEEVLRRRGVGRACHKQLPSVAASQAQVLPGGVLQVLAPAVVSAQGCGRGSITETPAGMGLRVRLPSGPSRCQPSGGSSRRPL